MNQIYVGGLMETTTRLGWLYELDYLQASMSAHLSSILPILPPVNSLEMSGVGGGGATSSDLTRVACVTSEE